MAATKKGTTGAASEDTTTMTMTTTPSQDKAAATQANGTNSDDISVDTIADGQHEVNLLDLGISAKTSRRCAASTRASKKREGLNSRPWKLGLRSDR